MPAYQGLVSEERLLQLIEYVQALGPVGAAVGAARAGGRAGRDTPSRRTSTLTYAEHPLSCRRATT